MTARVRIVGCGRWTMGDDQVGLIVADRLRELQLPGAEVLSEETPGTGILREGLDAVRLLVIVDAGRAHEQHLAGTIGRIDYRARPDVLSPRPGGQTHGLGVDTGLKLAASLGLLPEWVWIFVILGKCFDRRAELSSEVAAGIGPLVDLVEKDVRTWLAGADRVRNTLGKGSVRPLGGRST